MKNEDFWDQVNLAGDGCWLWVGETDKGRYGRFWNGKQKVMSHRLSYSLLIEPLEKKDRLKHVCSNTLCVNPDHLVIDDICYRFWSRIIVKSMDDCWNWLGSKDKDGYGYFWYKGKTEKAHRISWLLAYGEIPDGLCVCHRCDNPSCVNPSHLFSGTSNDNTQDKVMKGRQSRVRGSNHAGHKLIESNVLEIRKRIKDGEKQKDLAVEYKVSRATICLINKRKNWRWLDESYSDN